MTPVPMELKEDRRVREIYAACHPTWPERLPEWFWAHSTLVLKRDKVIVGFTSFSLSIAPTPELGSFGDDVMYGHDVCVLPTYQGHGFGLVLAEERLRVAERFGVKMFIGMSWRENTAMLRIFDKQHCTYFSTIPGGFPHNIPKADGLVYIKKVG